MIVASVTSKNKEIDDSVSRYWERVLTFFQEQNEGYLHQWFTTRDGFQGRCLIDRGTGYSRVVELKNHLGLVKITSVEGLTAISEPPKPEKVQLPPWLGEAEVGDRVTWDDCPSWWNPNGERLSEIVGGFGIVDYWRSKIEYCRLRVVIKALVSQEVDA